MNRAVADERARMSSTSSPSSIPRPAASLRPSTTFSAASCSSGRKTNPPPSCGMSTVQPVESARDFLNVRLGVAAVDAERVQLHQLARVVLVQSARPPTR